MTNEQALVVMTAVLLILLVGLVVFVVIEMSQLKAIVRNDRNTVTNKLTSLILKQLEQLGDRAYTDLEAAVSMINKNILTINSIMVKEITKTRDDLDTGQQTIHSLLTELDIELMPYDSELKKSGSKLDEIVVAVVNMQTITSQHIETATKNINSNIKKATKKPRKSKASKAENEGSGKE